MSVPGDMTEAAAIDGLGYFGIYFRIMLPIGMPAFWAQFVLAFVGGYNEYLGPMLYLKNAQLLTLQLALSQFSSSRMYTDPGAVMSAAIDVYKRQDTGAAQGHSMRRETETKGFSSCCFMYREGD